MRWALLLTLLFACAADDPCVDEDQDGFGEGCESGPDCDESNAARTDNCDVVPEPDCIAFPTATGCPCLAGVASGCFSGPETTQGVGLCRTGSVACLNGNWSLCNGEVVPQREICDGLDQDCDGVADNGVLSPCGGCTRGCVGGVWGDGGLPFEAGEGLRLTDSGYLSLAYERRLSASTVWVPNSGDNTVSRVDAIAGVETARYPSIDPQPSRVAVDYLGDAWVANRAFDSTPSLIKIASDTSRCLDEEGDGVQTSSGPSDVIVDDECVILRVPFETGSVPRALALDGDAGLDGAFGGNPWVGLHDAEAVVALSGQTGEVLQRVETPGFQPYAGSFDPFGTLWLISREGVLGRIDTGQVPLQVELIEVPRSCFLLYSMVIDNSGNIYVTGFSCDQVHRYSPESGQWTTVRTQPSPRGIGLLGDQIWFAHTGGTLSSASLSPLRPIDTFPLSSEGHSPVESIGVGVDGLDQIWTVSTHDLSSEGHGLLTGVSGDGTIVHQIPVGFAPHTQGDLTGAELLGGFVPEASTSQVFAGCAGNPESTDWQRLHLHGRAGAAGEVQIRARRANTESELAAAPWRELGVFPGDASPYDLDVAPGGVLEVELTLRTRNLDSSPLVRLVGVEWSCAGPI